MPNEAENLKAKISNAGLHTDRCLRAEAIGQLTSPSHNIGQLLMLRFIESMLKPKNTFAPHAGHLLIDVNTWLNLENSEDRTRPYTILGTECDLPHPRFVFFYSALLTTPNDTKRSMYDGSHSAERVLLPREIDMVRCFSENTPDMIPALTLNDKFKKRGL